MKSMATTSVRLPQELIGTLERTATRRGVSRSELVRQALEAFLKRSEQRPSSGLRAAIERLVTYPGSGQGNLATDAKRILRERFRARRHRSRR